MEIGIQELVTFAALLGAGLVILVGIGIRAIYVAFLHTGRERIELIMTGLGIILFFGGFFLLQLARIIVRF